jgi:hypothetical protein
MRDSGKVSSRRLALYKHRLHLYLALPLYINGSRSDTGSGFVGVGVAIGMVGVNAGVPEGDVVAVIAGRVAVWPGLDVGLGSGVRVIVLVTDGITVGVDDPVGVPETVTLGVRPGMTLVGVPVGVTLGVGSLLMWRKEQMSRW